MFDKLKHFGTMVKNAIIQHPIEILFVTYVTSILLPYGGEYNSLKTFQNLIALAPICFIVLYLARSTKAYWLLILLPIAIALFFTEIKLELIKDSRYWAVMLCTFLCLISQHWHKNNTYFVRETVNKLVNIGFAFVLATIIFAALSAITFAITKLFNLNSYDYSLFERFWIFSIVWAFPVLFLTLEHQRSADDSTYLNRVGEMLLNWILSPALIIYTTIIYAYVVYIIIRGEMPNGVVANVAFPYLTIGLAIQAVQLLLQNAKWQWFYRYYVYLALLPLALVWYAIYIRLSNYGLTEARIYLAIGAITLSICYGLLLVQRFAQYRLFSAVSIAVILISVFVLDPQQMAIKDQTQRLDRYLKEHNLLDKNNKIDKEAVFKHKQSLDDNRAEIERFNSMVSYVAREFHSEKFKEKYGIESSYELISERDYNENPRIFETSDLSPIRLTKTDMENVKEFIVLERRFYRPTHIYTRRTEEDRNQCQTLIYQGYDFTTNEFNADNYTKTAQACDEIKAPTEFIIAFKGIEPEIQFNIDDEVRKIFDKHNLDITQTHQYEVLENIKSDLLNIDLGSAVLSLSDIRLQFEDNIGYMVDNFSMKYLMFK
ncbi:hypothetical protein X781_20350 [Mannheimia sp. USDA-ARS-USMARC-1261]|uniref:DUF4153 domain-containing protein n=1 Tax=Mannheimia sp. USDA-ARS-USMARC-1261 TaxID=1432056 RepID=UPI0003E3C083|nr:DUF4153 domain-containing protein [Mannheimia sp. USDA-ARS-USMARC-1261]AHG74180.1 hypothetical protein X781_20350 [Mannheimia sp. USDA-ARS-USMARC-1261]